MRIFSPGDGIIPLGGAQRTVRPADVAPGSLAEKVRFLLQEGATANSDADSLRARMLYRCRRCISASFFFSGAKLCFSFCAPYCKITPAMSTSNRKTMRVAFQGEPGAFSEAAAIQLLCSAITTVPPATFDAAFTAIA